MRSHMQTENADILVLMLTYIEADVFFRQLYVYSTQGHLQAGFGIDVHLHPFLVTVVCLSGLVQHLLDTPLELQLIDCPGIEHGRCYQQNNIKLTRKFTLPAIVSFLEAVL